MMAWVDIETEGLDVRRHSILEVGIQVTTDDLELVGEPLDFLVYGDRPRQEWERWEERMDSTAFEMHSKNGLLEDYAEQCMSMHAVQLGLVGFMQQFDTPPPMCGSSVHFDREFLKAYMPEFESMFHYRNIDVSTVKQLMERWHPEGAASRPRSVAKHRVVPDIMDSINELAYYKGFLFSSGPQHADNH